MANITNRKATAPAPKGKGFLKGVKSELKKVIWPTKKETVNYTVVVIFISLIVALLVYILDFAFTGLLNLIVR